MSRRFLHPWDHILITYSSLVFIYLNAIWKETKVTNSVEMIMKTLMEEETESSVDNGNTAVNVYW